MLRLVVDDETQYVKNKRDSDDAQPDPSDAPVELTLARDDEEETEASKPRRKRRGRPVIAEVPQAEQSPGNEDAVMEMDGAVEDAAETAEDEASESAEESDINLGLLEAMLFGTHHPLTPGRLAELLELKTTAPVRRAIKKLNAGYEESGRSFRIEQVAGRSLGPSHGATNVERTSSR